MDFLLYLPFLAAFAIVNVSYTFWCMKNTLHVVAPPHVFLFCFTAVTCYQIIKLIRKLDKIIKCFSEIVNP